MPSFAKWVLGIAVAAFVIYALFIDPQPTTSSDCTMWLDADDEARIGAVEDWLEDNPDAQSTDKWKSIYADYVTVACNRRETNEDAAPDNVGDNLDDALEALG